MKKLYLIVLSLFIYSGSSAQTYYPLLDSVSNVWYFTVNVVPVRVLQPATTNCLYGNFTFGVTNTLVTTGDTIINLVNYKKLIQEEYNQPISDCTFGYLREDTATQKVFFLDNQFAAEELLYDFSMNTGDSINLDFFSNFGYFTSGYFHLDSIGSVNLPAGTRRIFYLNNHAAPTQFPLEWIESVGHPGHTIYTKSANFWGGLFSWICVDNIARDYYQQLTCFEHNAQKVYFDSCAHAYAVNNWCFFYADSCNYWNICGSVEELGEINSFAISPNPIQLTSHITVDANRETNAIVYIYGMDGRQLYHSKALSIHPGNNKFPLQTSQYRHGTYVVELRFKEGSLYQKMVVIN
ncbi:MAG: T9SS type A sorting domain-containing protein [Bacteroidetes bacterium]|nr:T9SS type A sorting domain-containing protein [Bacteroidota bacterium]